MNWIELNTIQAKSSWNSREKSFAGDIKIKMLLSFPN